MNRILRLTDLIDVEVLQQVQDGFSDMTGIGAVTADGDGVAVTKGSNFTDFCKLTRKSGLGCIRCNKCDKAGALLTLEEKPNYYKCHAGLVDFAAPIMANGKVVGSFIGGQVLTEPPDLLKVSRIADQLGIDKIQYVKAIKRVRIVDENFLQKAASFLHVIAHTLSNIAWRTYRLHQSNQEVERAAKAKSDFLANMSHEIRTPMNAVLGMAEMALREDMSPQAREYIYQIKASGKNLLVIINDILDFSKIESGKMEIIDVDYEPQSLINDLSSIVINRIGDKNVEFTMDVPLNLPHKLEGDNIRIQQILINLLNNAVKFTREGEVHLKLECVPMDDEVMLFKAAVRDTGSGIRERDMGKLFGSFEQVDTKRNRNIEGTGLGLSITQRLLELMNGSIKVQSEYGKGSTFFIEIPQRIISDKSPDIVEGQVNSVALIIGNPYVRGQIEKDLHKVGISYTELDVANYRSALECDMLIASEELMSDAERHKFIKDNPDYQFILLVNYGSSVNYVLPNVCVIQKPVYSFALYAAMNIAEGFARVDNNSEKVYPFIAPDAYVLVVDDNAINLTVARGLLEPLQMHIDEALSAKEAIEKMREKKYDIVFMDHMMPEVDGVEATHIIRRLMPQYNDIPIIALTANAIGGTKEMFIREGMNDFVAKPIEVKDIVQKLRKWLPEDKIQEGAGEEFFVNEEGSDNVPDIEGLDTRMALSLLGSEKLFWTVLRDYYRSIDRKIEVIQGHRENERWRDYTIEVHSLKSVSRQVGANRVSAMAAEMERAGNAEDIAAIRERTDEMLSAFAKYKEILAPYFPDEVLAEESAEADAATVEDLLVQMEEALEAFDSLMMEDVVEKMSCYDFSDNWKEHYENLKLAVDDSDMDACEEIVSQWREDL